MDDLTQANLKEILHYDPLTGVFVWKFRVSNRISVGSIAGSKSKNYLNISVQNKTRAAHRLAFLYMTGRWPTATIDHINGDGFDNRWHNLREATLTQNQMNKKLPKSSSSGVKGVCWDKSQSKWLAHITVNRKFINLGRFDEIECAAAAVNIARINYHGEYSNVG